MGKALFLFMKAIILVQNHFSLFIPPPQLTWQGKNIQTWGWKHFLKNLNLKSTDHLLKLKDNYLPGGSMEQWTESGRSRCFLPQQRTRRSSGRLQVAQIQFPNLPKSRPALPQWVRWRNCWLCQNPNQSLESALDTRYTYQWWWWWWWKR